MSAKNPKNSNCPTCGITFRFAKGQREKYCSQSCSAKAQPKTGRAQAVCEQCGKSFEWKKKHSHGRFCGRPCWFAWRAGNKKEKVLKGPRPHLLVLLCCHVCGNEFAARPTDSHRRKFCSQQCMGKVNVVRMNAIRAARRPAYPQVFCPICNKEVNRDPCRIAQSAISYCCRKCMGVGMSERRAGDKHPMWQGGELPYYGPSWIKQAQAARKRDGVCQDCGRTRESNGRVLSVHHLQPFRQFGLERHLEANVLSNLVTLCNPCHMRRERTWKRKKKHG